MTDRTPAECQRAHDELLARVRAELPGFTWESCYTGRGRTDEIAVRASEPVDLMIGVRRDGRYFTDGGGHQGAVRDAVLNHAARLDAHVALCAAEADAIRKAVGQ